jgi:predicted esterase
VITSHAFTLPVSYRYDLYRPAMTDGTLLLCLHGYGQNKETAMSYGRRIRQDWPVAALQAPHPHHLWEQGGKRKTGYSWVSDEAPGEDIANHHAFLRAVIDRTHEDGLVKRRRAFLFGFSQAVSLNYRFAAAHPGYVSGIVAVAGATPSSWAASPPSLGDLPVLHIMTREDAAYPPERALAFYAALERFTSALSWHELAGNHRVPRAAYPIIKGWLDRHEDAY